MESSFLRMSSGQRCSINTLICSSTSNSAPFDALTMQQLDLTATLNIPALEAYLDSISSRKIDKIEDREEEDIDIQNVVQPIVEEPIKFEKTRGSSTRGKRGRRFHKPKPKGQSFMDSL